MLRARDAVNDAFCSCSTEACVVVVVYDVQLDNQLPGAVFPIVFAPVPPPKSVAAETGQSSLILFTYAPCHFLCILLFNLHYCCCDNYLMPSSAVLQQGWRRSENQCISLVLCTSLFSITLVLYKIEP